ncbi:restriction endonuclease subunit S [Colwellia psychrerythraea]|uniref:Restriction modification system DNA specificity domain-containing protein n=1 Tax=Colwellia psychrerythraea TaxID=28229 RepID=A0A099KME3_COLPS|nr:restriction endonuclease subunit S [Colwellia psychrerythraea]KGJ90823.1 restriction modification system DNA specificity domain-containing protein [Colwellia psychrerythraea]
MNVEKKIPEIRFKGFDDEWKLFTLGELGSVATNKRIFIHETSLIGDVPFYKIGTFGREPKLFISQELFDNYKKRYPFPEKGDLLFSVIGSIGRVVEYTGEDEYFQDSNVVWLKHDGAIVNSFLKQFYSIVEWEGIEGSTIKHLYNRTILGTKIQKPSKEEQTQIGNTFQKLDSLINQHQQKHDKLSNIKKAMLEKMFPKQGETIPEIRFKGFSGEWVEKNLGNVAKIKTGSSNREDSGRDGEYTFFDRSEDIRTSNIFLFDCEAVIVAGEGSDFIPKYFVGKFDLHQRTYAIMEFDDCDGKYLFYYIHLFRKHFSDQAVGSTVKSLRLPMFEGMPIKVPTKAEQEKVGDYFYKLDNIISRHQQQITKLNNVKQACLKKMFV